jgi:hypothetical protein
VAIAIATGVEELRPILEMANINMVKRENVLIAGPLVTYGSVKFFFCEIIPLRFFEEG